MSIVQTLRNLNTLALPKMMLSRKTRPAWVRQFIAWYWVISAPILCLLVEMVMHLIRIHPVHGVQVSLRIFQGICAICCVWGLAILLNRDTPWIRLACAGSAFLLMPVLSLFGLAPDSRIQEPVQIVLAFFLSLVVVLSVLELTRKTDKTPHLSKP